jgi:hypothetical protein
VSLPLSASQLAEVLPPGRGPFLKRRPLRLRLPKEPLGYPGEKNLFSTSDPDAHFFRLGGSLESSVADPDPYVFGPPGTGVN